MNTLFGTIIVWILITFGFAVSNNASANSEESSPHPVVDFLAEYLLYQNTIIGPALISVYSSFWEGRATLRQLSYRGLPAQLFTGRGPGWTSPAPENIVEDVEVPTRWKESLAAESHRNDHGYKGPPFASSIVLDLTYPAANAFLMMADTLNVFAGPFRWLLVESRMPCSEERLSSLTPVSALIDSHVSVACWSPGEEIVQVYEMYRPARNATPAIQRSAFWENQKLQMLRWQTISASRHMHQHPVVLGLVTHEKETIVDPWNGIQSPEEDDVLTKSMYMPAALALATMNASIKIFKALSHGYKTFPNGTLSEGIIGGQMRGEVDICVTPNGPTVPRLKTQRYLMVTTYGRTAFTFRAPSLSYEVNVYSLPFPRSLWIASICLILLCCFLVWLAFRGERYIDNATGLEVESWDGVLLLGLGAVCQQGSTINSRGEVDRLLVFFLFLSVLFLYTSYTASIFVLLQSTSKAIRTKEDLWRSRLDVGASNMPFNKYFFSKDAIDETGKRLYMDKISGKGKRPDNFLLYDEGVRRIRKGLFAYHSINIDIYPRIQATFFEHEKCDIVELKGFPPIRNLEMSATRGISITEMYKIRMMIISERGFLLRFAYKHVPPRPNKCTQQFATFSSVGLVDLRAAYYILFGGLATSVVIAILEQFIYQLQSRSFKRRILQSSTSLWIFHKVVKSYPTRYLS